MYGVITNYVAVFLSRKRVVCLNIYLSIESAVRQITHVSLRLLRNILDLFMR
jgi:hypothetical protein